MEIRRPSSALTVSPGPRGLNNLLAQLVIGQRLVATVETRLTETSFLLRLNETGQLLRAHSQLTLSSGQSLQLEVSEMGATPKLKVRLPEILVAPEAAAIRQALRQYLPRQSSLAELFSTLQDLAESSLCERENVPEALRDAIRAVLDGQAQRAPVTTAEGLKRAITDCGIFLEAKLAKLPQGTEFPCGSDLKNQLLTLANLLKNLQAPPKLTQPAIPAGNPAQSSHEQALSATWVARLKTFLAIAGAQVDVAKEAEPEPPLPAGTDRPPHASLATADHVDILRQTTSEQMRTPPVEMPKSDVAARGFNSLDAASTTDSLDLKTLLDKTEGALAKIVLDQLASLPKHGGEPIAWQIEFPFKDGNHGDSAKLRIVKESKSASQPEQAYWSVILQLSPPGLGTIHSRITLTAKRIETLFWSDQDATSDLLRAHLAILSARLQQAGLEIGRLDTVAGPPPENSIENGKLPMKLLDEHA